MSINIDAILAGISAAGASGAELAWFAPLGVTAPTDALTALTAAVNEVQTVTITGTPTGGTFTLSYAGATTAGIAYNATAAAVQAALEALTTIGAGSVKVTGGPGPATPYILTFRGILAITNIALLTASAASLTGGTTPAVTVVETTPGAPGFLSAGLVTEDGVEKALKESSNEIKAYGLSAVVRKIVTSSELTFKATFLESSLVAMAVYERLPLTGAGAIVPSTTGAFSIQEGTARTQRYAAAFDVRDGANAFRMFCPSVEVTDRDGFTTKAGEAITRGVTLTAYPNSAGVSTQTFYLIPSLASS